MILTSPPHSLQVSISISNTRFSLCAQVIDARLSVGVWSCFSFDILTFLLFPRLARVTIARYLLFGAPKVGALGEYAMETGQVNSWFWHQGNQPGYKIQWLEYHMGGAIAPRCIQLITDLAITSQ